MYHVGEGLWALSGPTPSTVFWAGRRGRSA